MLADLATRDGRPVLAFDLFGDLDLRANRVVTAGGLRALVDAAVTEAPGGVVYGASFENHPALVARLAERHTLLGNDPETLRAVRDPARLGTVLRDAGVPFPPTFLTAPPERSGRWLRKPLRGGGGTRVRDWRGGALPAGTFVQERIDGLACSAAAVGDGVNAVVLGLTEQLVGERAFGVRGYRWCGNIVPPRLPAGEREALLSSGARDLLQPGGRLRAAGLVRRRLHVGLRARVDARGQPASHRFAGGDRGGVRDRRLRRCTCAPAPASCRASRPRARVRPARPSCSPPRTWSSATASAGWSAACATSRTPASGSPRAIRSARS